MRAKLVNLLATFLLFGSRLTTPGLWLSEMKKKQKAEHIYWRKETRVAFYSFVFAREDIFAIVTLTLYFPFHPLLFDYFNQFMIFFLFLLKFCSYKYL